MKYFSTFTGIGGFELGIERAYGQSVAGEPGLLTTGHKPDTEHGTGGQKSPVCIGYSEIDKYAVQTYERHFNTKNYGDITTISPADLPDFDLFVGGFPCQAFSIAGLRRGFEDTRGTLFFDVARICAYKRPRHLVLENVKGLLSHDGGKTFQTILEVLANMGYRVEWQLLNSKDFGVPQNRERVYIVGHLTGECGRQVLPISPSDRKATFGTITTGYNKGQRTGSYVDETVKVKSATRKGYEEARVGDGINIGAAGSSTRRGRVQDKSASTLNTLGDVGTFDGSQIRRLTPVERERLQGFPDDWTSGVSDTQRYKQCGNAVTVNTVQAVMERLLPCLN